MRTVSGTLLLLLCLTLSACTTTETINDTLSSTTPGDWYNDGLLKADKKAIAFATINQANLHQNLASGRGEYLASMSVLLGVPSERQPAFFSAAQARYAQVAGPHSQDSALLLALLQDTARPFVE